MNYDSAKERTCKMFSRPPEYGTYQYELAGPLTSPASVQFSAASSSAVTYLIRQLGFLEVNGHELYPLQQPQAFDNPEDEQRAAKAFPFENFPDEHAAASDLAEHHQRHLHLHGVCFGRGGFAIEDVHKAHPLALTHGRQSLRGGVHCALVPFGVANPAAHQARISDGPLTFEDGRAQVVCAALAGAALSQTPLLMDLTDGTVHHLLQLRGDELVVYQHCSPQQAYSEMARWLAQLGPWKVRRSTCAQPPKGLPELDARPLKKLRRLCCQTAD
ncbi:hypothetical protein WJX73_000191 [Symbiochloris irregularis]|uniref:Uncharacterized protein n=1 Tax=Symbiochloris irregularis TaxID=706552 RepID=A0AAW1NMX1_9CHLO